MFTQYYHRLAHNGPRHELPHLRSVASSSPPPLSLSHCHILPRKEDQARHPISPSLSRGSSIHWWSIHMCFRHTLVVLLIFIYLQTPRHLLGIRGRGRGTVNLRLSCSYVGTWEEKELLLLLPLRLSMLPR